MNVSEVEYCHGAVLNRIIHKSNEPFSFETYPTKSNCSYIFNNKIGLYIKYSKKRMSPWTFSFHKTHQDEIEEMKQKLGDVFVVFVCGSDGIVGLSHEQLKEILDENHDAAEWVRMARTRNTKYSVSGSDGKMKLKMGKQEFPKNLLDKINRIKTKEECVFQSIFSGRIME